MNKKELMAMSGAVATDQMLEKARSDVPVTTRRYGHKYICYKHLAVMGAEAHGGILVINIYFTMNLRAGGRMPAYTLFLDRDSGHFLTYDYDCQKWRDATLRRLVWPSCSSEEMAYVSDADRKLIADFLKADDGTYRDILRYQDQIRAQQLEARHKRETDPWDAVMQKVPQLPKDWERWAGRNAVKTHFIFYEYTRHIVEGFCSRCEKMVPISKPHHNEMGRCPRCRQKIQYKSIGKAGRICTEEDMAYLLQPFGEKLIIREFCLHHYYEKGSYEAPDRCYEERRRVIVDGNLDMEVYNYGYYKHKYTRWIKQDAKEYDCSWYDNPYLRSYAGRVYGRTLPALRKKNLARTGLCEYLKERETVDPEKYLLRLKKHPGMELLAKACLPQLTSDLLDGKVIEFAQAHSLKSMLGIDKFRLKWLAEHEGGTAYLEWFQEENRQKRRISDQIIKWYVERKISPKDLCFISDRMSLVQTYNYLQRQMKQSGQDVKQILTTWKDYLSMAEKLGMDINDAIIYRASKLMQRHNEAVLLMEQKRFDIREAELTKMFPDVGKVCSQISEKYEYHEDETFAVLVPKGIRDIMNEGRMLHHCVGSEERYYDRICRQETYILFLRKQENLQKAYYTLEVEPGGTIRQKRTEYDRQNKDIEEVMTFLEKWQKIVTERMTRYDEQMARYSKDLRKCELKEMRKAEVRIHGGIFGGRLLAEVLEDDLMEQKYVNEAA